MSEKKAGRSNINFVIKYGKNITDILTEDQFDYYDQDFSYAKILQFKAMIPNPIAPLYQTLPQNTTWLQLSLSENVSIDSNVFQTNGFTSQTVWGITAAQAPSVSSDALQTIMKCCAFGILPDTIAAFSCYQLSFLQNGYRLNPPSYRAFRDKISAECPENSTTSTTTPLSLTSSSWSTSTSSGHVLGISEIGFGAIAIAVIFTIFVI